MKPRTLTHKKRITLPLYSSPVKAGFPSPAEDLIETKIDLNDILISHPSSTFMVRVEGNSMIEAGINSGDIIVVDKAIEAKNGDIVVAVVDGDFTVKIIHIQGGGITLIPANPGFEPIHIRDGMDFAVWGVVTYIIHKAS